MALFYRRRSDQNALVASALRINPSDRIQSNVIKRTTQAWQSEAWARYDDVGEVKTGVDWLSWSMSKLILHPAIIEDPSKEPVPLSPDDHPEAWQALERLKSPHGSHGPLIRSIITNWAVAGECYLHGTEDEMGESWFIRSVQEIIPRGNGWELTVDEKTGQPRALNDDDDFIIRLWLQHPRRHILADSPVHGILEPAEEVLILSRAVRSIARSRIHAGLVKLPSELSFGAADDTQDTVPEEDVFLKEFYEAVSTAIESEGSASAAVPLVVRGPAEYLKALEYISFERPFDEELDVRTERAIKRVAQGLPLPAEILLGMGDVSHWTAWNIDEAAFKSYIQPFADAMVDSITTGFLWPALSIDKGQPGVPIVWYNSNRVVSRPNKTTDYKDAYDRDSVTSESLRKTIGASENEAPSEEELLRKFVLRRGTLDPILTDQYLKKLYPSVTPEDSVEPTEDTKGPNKTEAGPKSDPSVPAESAPLTPDGSNTKKVSPGTHPGTIASGAPLHRLRDKVIGAADSAYIRAVDRAGARIRTKIMNRKDVKKSVAGVPNSLLASTMGEDSLASLGLTCDYLLEGSISSFKDQFYAWSTASGSKEYSIPAAWDHISTELLKLCEYGLFNGNLGFPERFTRIEQLVTEGVGLLQ